MCIETKKLVIYNVEHSRTYVLFLLDYIFFSIAQRTVSEKAAHDDRNRRKKDNKPRKRCRPVLEDKASIGVAEVEKKVNN